MPEKTVSAFAQLSGGRAGKKLALYAGVLMKKGKVAYRLHARVSPGKGYSIKYLAPFYYARLWSNYETAEATAKLIEIYQYQLEHIDEIYHSILI